ncbi:MAG: EF-hand domain-containing protein [Planctomycetes bacterium]|nr:EF-hand domain-containing protein [Planctomycetota bacterium]
METSPNPPQRRIPGWPGRAIVAVFALALYVGWRLLWHMADDAYITYRYLSNAMLGRGLVWNPAPFLPVDGNTDFLWSLLLLSIWRVFGIEPPAVANWLALGFGVVVFLLLARATWRLPLPAANERQRPLLLALVLALLVTNRAFLAALSSGLGVSIFNCLLFGWSLLAVSRRSVDRPRRWLLLGVVAAACGLARPEGQLVVVATAVLVVWWSVGPRRLGTGLAAAGCAIVPVAAHLVFRRLYYGDWLPCTYYAKNIGAWPASGVRYFGSFVVEFGVYVWLAVALVWLLQKLRSPGPLALLQRAHLGGAAVASVFLFHFAYYTFYMGGDLFEWRVYSHLVPWLPLSLLYMARSLGWRPRTTIVVLATYLALAAPIGWIKYAVDDGEVAPHVPSFLQPLLRPYDDWQRWLGDRLVCKRNYEMKVNLAMFESRAPLRADGARVPWQDFPVHAAEAVGVIGWVLPNVAIIDQHGLNDAVVARAPLPSAAEWLQQRTDAVLAGFRQFDGDHDGRVTIAEYRAWLAAFDPELARRPDDLERAARGRIAGFDANGDGVVTTEEFLATFRLHGDRMMAHERLPQPGYVEGFRPNVVVNDRVPVVQARDVPLTEPAIRDHEAAWRARVGLPR